jgi:hypothetical protein
MQDEYDVDERDRPHHSMETEEGAHQAGRTPQQQQGGGGKVIGMHELRSQQSVVEREGDDEEEAELLETWLSGQHVRFERDGAIHQQRVDMLIGEQRAAMHLCEMNLDERA